MLIIDRFVEGKQLEEIEAEDKEEEEEAKNIQKRLAANLSEDDYDLNLLQVDFIHDPSNVFFFPCVFFKACLK